MESVLSVIACDVGLSRILSAETETETKDRFQALFSSLSSTLFFGKLFFWLLDADELRFSHLHHEMKI